MNRQSVVATFITTYKRTKLHEKEKERKEKERKKKQNKYMEENYPTESQNENEFGFNTKNMMK